MIRRLAALPAALAGLLFAHEFAYRLVAQDAGHRHALLDATGHGWTGLIPTIFAVTILGSFIQAWRRTAGQGRTPSLWQVLLLQSISYAIVEIGERLISGHSPWPGFALLIAGAVVQFPAALIVWAVLRYVVTPAVEKVRQLLSRHQAHVKLAIPCWTNVEDTFRTRFAHQQAGRAPPSFC